MKLLEKKLTEKINDMIGEIVSTCNKILSTDRFYRHINLALFVMGLLLCIQFHPYS